MRRRPTGRRTNGFEGRRRDFMNRAFMNGSGIERRVSNPSKRTINVKRTVSFGTILFLG
jgi:hypothetical protein